MQQETSIFVWPNQILYQYYWKF